MNWYIGPMAILKRPKLSGLGEHVGVLQPDGNVFHTSLGRGVEVVSLQEFAAGRPVQVVEQIAPGERPYALTRIQTELWLQRPYDAIVNNCEIVARRVAGKPAESPQVQFWLLLTALLGVLALAKSGQ